MYLYIEPTRLFDIAPYRGFETTFQLGHHILMGVVDFQHQDMLAFFPSKENAQAALRRIRQQISEGSATVEIDDLTIPMPNELEEPPEEKEPDILPGGDGSKLTITLKLGETPWPKIARNTGKRICDAQRHGDVVTFTLTR